MNVDIDWAPASCTLPTVERPLRMAEFSALFAALRRVDRPSPTRLCLVLAANTRDEAVRLADAESSCCSFFSFTVDESAGGLVVSVDVPAAHVDVLDALAAQATAAGASS